MIDWGPYGTTPACYMHRYAMDNSISLSIVYPIVTVYCSYVLDTNTRSCVAVGAVDTLTEGLLTEVRNAALPGLTLRPLKSIPHNAKADKSNAPENRTLGDGNPLLAGYLNIKGFN